MAQSIIDHDHNNFGHGTFGIPNKGQCFNQFFKMSYT